MYSGVRETDRDVMTSWVERGIESVKVRTKR